MLLGVTFGSAVLFVVIADAVDKDVAAAAVGAVVAATVAAAGATAEVDVVAVSGASFSVDTDAVLLLRLKLMYLVYSDYLNDCLT